MEITVSSRHTEVSEALRAASIEKIGRLSRFVEGMDRGEVHFSEHRNHRNPDREALEVTLEGHGHHVRCKVSAPDGFAALDLAVEKLEHQLHRLKSKLQGRAHGGKHAPRVDRNDDGALLATALLDADSVLDPDGEAERALDAEGDGALRIVKTKRFTMKPMAPAEAALQMELLGHDFFFFTNADTDHAAVVYRRGDGDVGLIDEA